MICAVFSARFLRSIQKIQRPEEARRFLRQDKYWCPEVVERLVKRVDDLVALKPKQALGIAEIALELTKRMRNPSQELQAHANCALAAALRSCGRLAEAESFFSRAEELSIRGSDSLIAMILRQKAVLFAEQGKSQALHLAQRAVALDEKAGRFPDKSLIGEGIVHYFRRDFPRSSDCFLKVVQNGDPCSDVYILAMEYFIASFLHRPLLGTEIAQARKSLRLVAERIKGVRSTPVRYQIWWVEGLLHSILDEFRVAVNHLMQARDGFLRLELIPDFSLVSIDLVEVLVKKGDPEKARVIINRTLEKIAEYEEHARFAEAYRLALDQPIDQAADFIRKRLSPAEESPAGEEK